MRNEKLGMRRKSKEILHFSFLAFFPFSLFPSPFSFFLLYSHFFLLFISHLSFLICHFFNFLICHFLTREREGDPCIDAQQDDEQGLDGVDNQYEEQGIV